MNYVLLYRCDEDDPPPQAGGEFAPAGVYTRVMWGRSTQAGQVSHRLAPGAHLVDRGGGLHHRPGAESV